MQRTTTTATLLVATALTALTGCVTVQDHPSAPGAPPSASSRPRSDSPAGAQVAQAPAREALESVDASGPSHPASGKGRWTADEGASGRRPAPHPLPAHPAPHRTGRSPVEVPDARGVAKGRSDAARRTTDVCALGKRYGGWRADSLQAVICEGTYGR
ncbi:hypothetical protein [Streptomyces longwoodensis]|uniref:hypothetical protein n=1 Tax=Streptomyces longwoodensis TaxID=68231 RepID=UPI00381BB588